MRKTHEVLRLHFDLKLKQRPIARSANLSQSTVREYLRPVHGGGFVVAGRCPKRSWKPPCSPPIRSHHVPRPATFLTFLTSTKNFRNTSTSPCSCCGKSTQLRIPTAIATVSSATTTSNGNASGT